MKTLENYINEKYLIDINTKHTNYKENWSIKNAEDGDVVVWNDLAYFIYKCLHKDYPINSAKDDAIVHHAYYIPASKKIVVCISTGFGDIYSNPENYKLATDEQCEEFYNALKKAGYKWDYNKNEVVKI